MTKTSRNSAAATEDSFHKHYAAIWGEERWHNSLYPALAQPTRHAALVNRYDSVSGFLDYVNETLGGEQVERLSFPTQDDNLGSEAGGILCFTRKRKPEDAASNEKVATNERDAALPLPKMSVRRLMSHWNLDAASALAAHLLNVHTGERTLDLCAAPGGKSVALAQRIWPQLYAEDASSKAESSLGSLTSNEYDSGRYKRLTENLNSYLPAQLFNPKHVSSLRIDSTDSMAARKLSIGSHGYDKVLVDAPCSSERHIIHAQIAAKAGGRTSPEMANWRLGSSKRLARTQVELVMTGLKSARIGGNVLYATCSIESTENDGVVEKVLAMVEKEVKKGGKWTVKIGFNAGGGDAKLEAELEENWAERTKYGWIVLPDHPSGGKWGPLFFVMLTRVEANG